MVDPENHRASIVLEMNTGPRYRFGATNLEQDSVNDPLIRRFIRYSKDEPFDATDLLRTQFALDDSLYFAFFFSSRRRHTRWTGDWSSDVCSSDLLTEVEPWARAAGFTEVTSQLEPHGLFGVTVCRK